MKNLNLIVKILKQMIFLVELRCLIKIFSIIYYYQVLPSFSFLADIIIIIIIKYVKILFH